MLGSLVRAGLIVTLLSGVPLCGAAAATLPTESEIVGIQMVCSGPGGTVSVSVKGKVDTAITSWRSASAGVEAEAAKNNLIGAFATLTGDSQLSAVYTLYVGCVKDTIQQFLDREKKAQQEAIKPPPATTVTYKVCSGEYERACQVHDVYMYCYADVAGWAKQRCSSSTVTRYSAYGGNKCGYALDLVLCTGPQ